MIGFANLVARFAPPPPSVVKIAAAAGQNAVILNFKRDWKTYMTIIAEKLDTAHAKRTELVEARRGLLLDAVQGEDAAGARLSKVEREIADLDRTVGQLRDAAELARERDDAEKAAEAVAEYKRQRAAWDAANIDTAQLAADVDGLAAKLAAKVVELREKVERQATTCPVPLAGAPIDRPLGPGRVEYAVQVQLAHAGLRWAWRGILPWKDIPTASSTVAEGIEWATSEIERAEQRKNV